MVKKASKRTGNGNRAGGESDTEKDDMIARLRAELAKTHEKAREGLETQTEKVAGFWLGTVAGGPCIGIPIDAVTFDNKLTPDGKPSVMLRVELTSPCVILTSEDEAAEFIIAPKGATVGVWYKPGMKDVSRCAGRVTCIEATGETKDVGKVEPMKLFRVDAAPGAKRQLYITGDYRKESKHFKLPFPVTATDEQAAPALRGKSAPADDDDIPF